MTSVYIYGNTVCSSVSAEKVRQTLDFAPLMAGRHFVFTLMYLLFYVFIVYL